MGWIVYNEFFFSNVVMQRIRKQKIVTKVKKDLFPGNPPFLGLTDFGSFQSADNLVDGLTKAAEEVLLE